MVGHRAGSIKPPLCWWKTSLDFITFWRKVKCGMPSSLEQHCFAFTLEPGGVTSYMAAASELTCFQMVRYVMQTWRYISTKPCMLLHTGFSSWIWWLQVLGLVDTTGFNAGSMLWCRWAWSLLNRKLVDHWCLRLERMGSRWEDLWTAMRLVHGCGFCWEKSWIENQAQDPSHRTRWKPLCFRLLQSVDWGRKIVWSWGIIVILSKWLMCMQERLKPGRFDLLTNWSWSSGLVSLIPMQIELEDSIRLQFLTSWMMWGRCRWAIMRASLVWFRRKLTARCLRQCRNPWMQTKIPMMISAPILLGKILTRAWRWQIQALALNLQRSQQASSSCRIGERRRCT